ncbi:MAG TPA: serine hydrolase domain-containing protein [Lachnospiraceae bacterium]|nr:serine hydrolase domain-containing protein [Lachnospiraceae bacterium]
MNFDKLTKYIDSLESKYGIPAVDCKITKDHKVIYRHMAGNSDYEKRKPLTDKNLFRLFSATKLITMTAVLQLVEAGKIRLYDELRQYLPEFDRLLVADEFVMEFPTHWPTQDDKCHLAHKTIRIIDLMTMTAGLSYDTGAKELMYIKEKSDNQATTRDVVREMAKMPLIYEPATRWSYSLAHDILAAVVEVISGMKFSDYLKKNIFEPLEIKDFYFHWDSELEKRICAIYMGVWGTDDIKPDDGFMSNGFKITNNYESGGAGLAGSVDAYSMFADALCNDGVGANGKRILGSEMIALFTIEYTQGQMQTDFEFTGKIGYGYGLGVRVLRDGTASKTPIGEFGWDGAAGAYVVIDPFNHISIFYTQHIVGYPKVYSDIHPMIRDLSYEAMEL